MVAVIRRFLNLALASLGETPIKCLFLATLTQSGESPLVIHPQLTKTVSLKLLGFLMPRAEMLFVPFNTREVSRTLVTAVVL